MSLSSLVDWKFSQVFGERCPGEDIQDVDIISAIEFDKSGDYLAVGDRGGRVVIFERKDEKDTPSQPRSRYQLEQLDFISTRHPEYRYKTEFQSHEPEFDYLKSLEIEEKINKVRWCAAPNDSILILSTNDKTIKLWKVKDQKMKKIKEMNAHPFVCSENSLLAERSFTSGQDSPSLSNGLPAWTGTAKNMFPSQEILNKIANAEDTAYARSRRVYAHAHDFNINSISNNSDGETFISADDLRINLWNLEISSQCFNIIDMKPSSMEDLIEVITSATFHPIDCNLLAFSTSRGYIRLVDMRQSALCDNGARVLQDAEPGSKSLFTEIIAAISDVKFASDGRHILSRDYMNLKLWDIRRDSSPVSVFKIHEHLRTKLCDLYNDDLIFDKFECCLSRDGLNFATGSYGNLLRIFSSGCGGEEGITIEASKTSNRKPLSRTISRARRSSLSNLTRGFYGQDKGDDDCFGDLSSKLLHLAWHPTTPLIACASGSSLFLYHA
ncbi:serine/threonine protein phosphatase 2A 55 kDa regulatory subunit B beta isoform-like isoform X2 [Carica papaya]|uniref:serine/threonine protein phosphatase 2A 55 kDa regulatory subunit B beta isoform-like isoform X2 n=1 Tax=Carica papaya TaxID=3649 RepID=UPI000B8CECD9|nr:serine/threonine protein phosphatase 2A 55 kDa regulatory subunit B beta isoform-like isoform X2 [Carica papaya]